MWYASTSSIWTWRYGTSKGRRSVSGCCQTPCTARALAEAGRSRNHRDGAPRGSGLYTVLGRAGYPSHLARPSHCAPEALRGTSDDETMTSPGGAGTPYKSCHVTPRARRIGFYHGSELSVCLAPALRSATPRCPKPSPSCPMPCALLCPRTPAQHTWRGDAHIASGPGPIGVGLC
jgi:hypothetical protein